MADERSRAGGRYATEELLTWVARVHASHDAGLAHAFEAPTTHGMPAIQLGPLEGRALEVLLRLTQARRVVEVGTLAGYSALWAIRALPPEGHVWTIEFDDAHADVAEAEFVHAGVSDRITVCRGPAIDVLPDLVPQGPFDAVFIDADKGNYDVYGRWAAQNLRPGGLLVGDNAFYFGNLMDESEEASAMRRFHEEAAQSFVTTCLPTPDGLVVGVRRP